MLSRFPSILSAVLYYGMIAGLIATFFAVAFVVFSAPNIIGSLEWCHTIEGYITQC